MFETSKLPTEQRTVTGNPVSFNTHYALPLDACKISFEATQSGSGDPSPSNPRAISGVSAIGLTANSTPVSVSLGDTRYGGELDLLTGIMTITDVAYKIKDLSFSYVSAYSRFQSTVYSGSRLAPIHNAIIVEGLMCECYITGRASSGSGEEYPDKRIAVAAISSYLFIYDSSYTDVDTMKSAVGDYYVKWRLKADNYITIQLTPTQLSTIIGNNTFSTDTGTLEITFADLQEKSASGSVASFNTALAMPLPSCNIGVNARQEGSGDPYPAGGTAQRWDEEWEQGTISTTNGNPISSTNQIRSKNYTPCLPDTVYYLSSNGQNFRIFYYDINKDFISVDGYWLNRTFTTPVNAYYLKISSGSAYGGTYKNDVSINYPATDTAYHAYSNERPIHGFSEVNATRAGKNLLPPILNNDQQSIYANGVTLTVNNGKFHIEGLAANSGGRATLRTKNFLLPKGTYYIFTDRVGSAIFLQDTSTIIKSGNGKFTLTENMEVYVGFNVVNGTDYNETFYVQIEAGSTASAYEPYVTPTIYTIQLGQEVYGAEVDAVNGVAHVTHGYIEFDGREGWVATTVSGFPCFQIARGVLPTSTQFISNYIKRVVAMTASEYIGYVDDSNFNVRFTSDTTLTEFKKVLSYNNMQIVYELATPFDIQLTPTQIATIIGNNTIFADTGDVDLTYKDCDLAKRGDFRQVFKIPD